MCCCHSARTASMAITDVNQRLPAPLRRRWSMPAAGPCKLPRCSPASAPALPPAVGQAASVKPFDDASHQLWIAPFSPLSLCSHRFGRTTLCREPPCIPCPTIYSPQTTAFNWAAAFAGSQRPSTTVRGRDAAVAFATLTLADSSGCGRQWRAAAGSSTRGRGCCCQRLVWQCCFC